MRGRRKTLTTLAALLAISAIAQTPKQDREWATRIPCEMQTAQGRSLQDMRWLQGTTPLISLDQYRSGRAVNADKTATAVLRFAPSATATKWVSVTNYATTGNAYLVQLPTIGTNTPPAKPWYYTALFFRGGQLYWTGSGKLHIEATTATGKDGLEWQDITSFGGVSIEELQQALEPIEQHLTNAAIHLTPEQAERIANAITSAPPQTVQSVNGKTGDVVLDADDVGAATPGDLAGYLPLAGGTMAQGAAIELSTNDGDTTVDGWGINGVDSQDNSYRLGPGGFYLEDYTGSWTTYQNKMIQMGNALFLLPDKPEGYYTLATLDDIPPPPELPEGILTQEEATNIVKAVTATVWQTVTNTAATVTLTADRDNPIRWVGAGNPTLTLTGLVEGVPIYLTVSGMDSLTINNAYYVGGGMYQTNRVNHYLVWSYGGELLVTPITTTTEAGQ